MLVLVQALGHLYGGASAATDYYVATGGSDSNSGTLAQPFKTIGKAALVASSGDTVYIGAGTYPETVSLTRSGLPAAPIVFRAQGNGAVWVDGACTRTNVFDISADHLTIVGIGVKRANEANIRLDASDHITLDGLTVQDWACAGGEDQFRAGVASWGGGSHLTVVNSRFERRVDVAGTDDGYGNAIWLKNTGASAGGGHLISGNTIIGGYDGIGGEPEDVSWGAFNHDSTIENNTVSDCSDDGIQVEGGTANVMVQGNTVKRCLIGIAFAPALTGPLTIQRNVISEPIERFGLGAAMFKAGDSSVGEVRVYHNSFFAGSTPADGLKQTNADLRNITLKNNAIYSSRYVIETGSHTGTVSANYDAMYTSDSGRFVKWNGSTYNPLSSFRNATGQEMNGTSPASFGWDATLRPLAGSPLIDAGVVIPGANDGFSGSRPDVGAFEFGVAPTATPPPSPPLPSPTPTPSPAPATPTPTPTSAPPTPTPSPTPQTPSATPTPDTATPTPRPPTPTPTPASPTPTPTPTAAVVTPTPPTTTAPATPTPTSAPVLPTLTPTPTPTGTPAHTPQTPTPSPDTLPTTPVPTPTPAPTEAPATPPPSDSKLRGDIDCSGIVDSVDALKVLKVVSGKGHFAKCAGSADIDCSGSVTASDARRILRYIARFPAVAADNCPLIGAAE